MSVKNLNNYYILFYYFAFNKIIIVMKKNTLCRYLPVIHITRYIVRHNVMFSKNKSIFFFHLKRAYLYRFIIIYIYYIRNHILVLFICSDFRRCCGSIISVVKKKKNRKRWKKKWIYNIVLTYIYIYMYTIIMRIKDISIIC